MTRNGKYWMWSIILIVAAAVFLAAGILGWLFSSDMPPLVVLCGVLAGICLVLSCCLSVVRVQFRLEDRAKRK